MTDQPVLSLDFETASTADLRKCGAHKYAQNPSTGLIVIEDKAHAQ